VHHPFWTDCIRIPGVTPKTFWVFGFFYQRSWQVPLRYGIRATCIAPRCGAYDTVMNYEKVGHKLCLGRQACDSQAILWLQERIQLDGYDVNLWIAEHNEKAIAFLSSPRLCRLLFYMLDDKLQLATTFDAIASSCKKLYYFIHPEAKLSITNIGLSIQHGILSCGADMRSLLEVMGQIFTPQIIESCTWPESMKKDLSGQVHKFMASLTESAFEATRKTMLYLPSGEFLPDIALAARNKELVQQLESIVINWTRQIKEVVNSYDNAHQTEVPGPLEEILFWRSRREDLFGILQQLQRGDVRQVIHVLDVSKSSYLTRFMSLAKKIHDNSIEANDNIRFLEHLVSPCTTLSNSGPFGNLNG